MVFITVNYKRPEDTRDFVASVAALDGFDRCRIVIVDNASTPGSRQELSSLSTLAFVTMLYSEENRFYWGGAAWALRTLYPAGHGMPEWVVICNNDTLVEQRDFLERLLAQDPTKGVVIGPSISGPDGKNQNPFLLTPHGRGARLFWALYHCHYGMARLLRGVRWILRPLRQKTDPRRRFEGGPVYAVHGAFLCISRSFFEVGGYLDDRFELFAEELTLAETARRLGLSILYNPELKVIHRDHGASAARLTRWAYDHHRRGWRYFVRTHRRGDPGPPRMETT